MTTSTELTVVQFNPPAALEINVDELDGVKLDPRTLINTVKVPAGGATTFEIPDSDGVLQPVKEIVGVVIYSHATSRTWLTDDKGARPDAASYDGVTQVLLSQAARDAGMSTILAQCPMNPDSVRPRDLSRPTQNRRSVYIVTENSELPVMLDLPPTGLWPFESYMGQAVKYHKSLCKILTRFYLEKEKGKSGDDFSRLKIAFAGRIDPDTAAVMQTRREQLRAFVKDINAGYEAAPTTAAIDATPVATSGVDGLAAALNADEPAKKEEAIDIDSSEFGF